MNRCSEHGIILNELRHNANRNSESLITTVIDFTNVFASIWAVSKGRWILPRNQIISITQMPPNVTIINIIRSYDNAVGIRAPKLAGPGMRSKCSRCLNITIKGATTAGSDKLSMSNKYKDIQSEDLFGRFSFNHFSHRKKEIFRQNRSDEMSANG
jgi:hypothetical protein